MDAPFLCFIKEVTKLIDDKFVYDFVFTNEPEMAWGEYFNIAPSSVIPNLMIYEESIGEIWRIESPYYLVLAKNSSCFSMQDSFDNIIPLAFVDIEKHDLILYNEKVLKFEFGEAQESVEKKIKEFNFNILEKNIIDNNPDIEIIKTQKDDFKDDDEIIKAQKDTSKDLEINLMDDKISFSDLKQLLIKQNFSKKELVSQKGEYAIRGNIIDIFDFSAQHPYRFIFDNNTIEKIIFFNEEDNQIISDLEEVSICLN